MIPNAPELLRGSFIALAQPAADETGAAFAQATVRTVALLCFLLAQEAEKAASTLVTENQALRTLFEEAAAGAWAPALSPRLRELARGEDQDLSLSALSAANAHLRRGLIALQETVEEARGAAGRARERRIRRLLREGARARLLTLPNEPVA